MNLRRKRISGVYIANLERLVWVLREKYPQVLEADRRFEEETNVRNKVGTNNLVDALSHIGTLFEAAPDATFQEQRAQVTLFEDHLRRTMMEAWEQMLDFQAGEIDKLWYDEYLVTARPMQLSGELPGSPSADQLDSKRKRYMHLLHEGRGYKRGVGWSEWEKGTDKFIEACKEAAELREQLQEAIKAGKAARERTDDRELSATRHEEAKSWDTWNKVLAVIAILVTLLLGIGVGTQIGGDDTSSSSNLTKTDTGKANENTSKQAKAPE